MNNDICFQNFCHNFRYIRKQNNLTQIAFAQRLRISTDYVRRLEKDEIPPRLRADILFDMSRQFGVPMDTLLHTRLDGE